MGQGQGLKVKNNGTHGKDTQVKYQRSSTHCSKVISKVKVFTKLVKLQSQGNRVKNNGTRKGIKALALVVQTLLARLKLLKNGSNSKVKVTE